MCDPVYLSTHDAHTLIELCAQKDFSISRSTCPGPKFRPIWPAEQQQHQPCGGREIDPNRNRRTARPQKAPPQNRVCTCRTCIFQFSRIVLNRRPTRTLCTCSVAAHSRVRWDILNKIYKPTDGNWAFSTYLRVFCNWMRWLSVVFVCCFTLIYMALSTNSRAMYNVMSGVFHMCFAYMTSISLPISTVCIGRTRSGKLNLASIAARI